MGRRIAVLVYGDCPELERCDLDLYTTHLDGGRLHDETELKVEAFDAAVVDASSGDDTALDCVRALHKLSPSCPSIMIVEPGDIDLARRGLEMGLTDHVVRCGTTEQAASLLTHALERCLRHSYLKERFHESERRFWSFFDNSPMGLVIMRLSGQCEHANPTFAQMVGRSVDELRTIRLESLLDEEDAPIWSALRREFVSRDRSFVHLEQKFVHENGEPRWTNFTCVAMSDTDGNPSYLLGMITDRTDRKRIQEQLQHADKMQSMGRLAGGVAHDFNNLLTIVNSHCFIMRDALDEPDKITWSVDRILTATARGSKLTRQLLTFGRQQARDTEPVDPNEVLEKMEVVLESLFRKTTSVEFALGDDLRQIDADQSQIEQIVMNLALNARDAMEEGGRFTVRSYNLDVATPSSAMPSELPRGHYTVLEISDTGSGMPPEVQKRAFDPFFTTKEVGDGTGLGLSTVYGVVTQNEGHITVDSEVGRGTTFHIYFPSITEDAQTPPKLRRVRRGTPTDGTETILLVEDEEELRIPLRNLLESKGYFVLEAANAEEALEQSREHQGTIDLLLTDVIMPGIDGVSLADELTSERPDTAVLLMSGYTADALSMDSDETQRRKLLQKPFGMDILSRTVRRMLTGP